MRGGGGCGAAGGSTARDGQRGTASERARGAARRPLARRTCCKPLPGACSWEAAGCTADAVERAASGLAPAGQEREPAQGAVPATGAARVTRHRALAQGRGAIALEPYARAGAAAAAGALPVTIVLAIPVCRRPDRRGWSMFCGFCGRGGGRPAGFGAPCGARNGGRGCRRAASWAGDTPSLLGPPATPRPTARPLATRAAHRRRRPVSPPRRPPRPTPPPTPTPAAVCWLVNSFEARAGARRVRGGVKRGCVQASVGEGPRSGDVERLTGTLLLAAAGLGLLAGHARQPQRLGKPRHLLLHARHRLGVRLLHRRGHAAGQLLRDGGAAAGRGPGLWASAGRRRAAQRGAGRPSSPAAPSRSGRRLAFASPPNRVGSAPPPSPSVAPRRPAPRRPRRRPPS
jgi:hypothetical protein